MHGNSCTGMAGFAQSVSFLLVSFALTHLLCMHAQAEAERKEREDSELQGATFRPEITRLARKMQLQQHSRQGSGGQGVGGTADDAKWARLSTTAFRKSTLVSNLTVRHF